MNNYRAVLNTSYAPHSVRAVYSIFNVFVFLRDALRVVDRNERGQFAELPSILLLFTLLLFFSTTLLFSQPLPTTEIFLGELSVEDGRVILGEMKNVTQNDGYDNQPWFLPDGMSFLFSSVRADTQADIFRYDIEDDTIVRITSTPESEYSPRLMPDGAHISAVRVEMDGTQRLWKFNLDGSNPEPVLKTIKQIGYYCWVDTNQVALYILGEPVQLALADIRTEKASTMANDVGRSLNIIPEVNTLSYVSKEDDSTWIIREYTPVLKHSVPIMSALRGSEDVAWLPNGTMLMGRGSMIYQYNYNIDSGWELCADLSGDGITGITRIAVNPEGDRITIVGEKK